MSNAVRKSNIELLRIVAMLLVLVVHVDFFSIGWPDKNEIINNPISTFMRIEFESLAIVCVNVFVLISGYFGIKLKLKSICNFLFQILFFRVVIYLAVSFIKNIPLTLGELLYMIIPGYDDWFVSAYIMLLLLSPILNSYSENNSFNKKVLLLIIFYVIQSLFGWLEPFWFAIYRNGYSIISFIGLYLLGRLIFNYQSNIILSYKKKMYLGMYLIISTVVSIIVYTMLYIIDINAIKTRIIPLMVAYSSPIVVFCSICLFVCFMKIKIQSKFINWIGVSAFSVYLVHTHPYIINYFKQTAKSIWQTYSGIEYVFIIIVFVIGIFIGSIILDKVRIFIWKHLILKLVLKFDNRINQYKYH